MRRLFVYSLFSLLLPLELHSEEGVLVLKGFDPIALAEGKEMPGLATIETTRGQFRYRFAHADNKAKFEANPELHGIQFAGACGKMGPFSGAGSPDRYFVHQQRIYLFASESCREAFKKAPEKYIDTPNPVPAGTEEQRKQGETLVRRALEGFGGADKVDSLKTYSSETDVIYQQNGKDYVGHHRIAWAFPDRYRFEENWGTAYGQIVDGKNSFQFAGKKSWQLEEGMVAIALRQALREPLAVLRLRQTPGFVAYARGSGILEEKPVDLLEVGLHGATSVWSIEQKTGRILAVSYVGRRGMICDIQVKYSDFHTVDGLCVPFGRVESVNGKPLTTPRIVVKQISMNPKQESQLFQRP